MKEQRFIVDLDDVYRGIKDLALGTLAESRERPGAAHVSNVAGAHYVAVWSEGEHSNYWQLVRATPQQVAAYERAPRAQVARRDPPAAPPPVVTAAPPAPLVQASHKPDWSAVLSLALESGRLTAEQRTGALQLLATGGPGPTTQLPKSQQEKQPMTSSADIYEARRTGAVPWDEVIAKTTPQRENATLDARAIYAARRPGGSQEAHASQRHEERVPSASEVYASRRAAAASWDDAIANVSNPQRM